MCHGVTILLFFSDNDKLGHLGIDFGSLPVWKIFRILYTAVTNTNNKCFNIDSSLAILTQDGNCRNKNCWEHILRGGFMTNSFRQLFVFENFNCLILSSNSFRQKDLIPVVENVGNPWMEIYVCHDKRSLNSSISVQMEIFSYKIL